MVRRLTWRAAKKATETKKKRIHQVKFNPQIASHNLIKLCFQFMTSCSIIMATARTKPRPIHSLVTVKYSQMTSLHRGGRRF